MPFLGKTPQQFVDPEVDIDGGSIDGTAIGATSASSATVTTFTSTGIDDNATSTAITIDSGQNVGIGETSPSRKSHTKSTQQIVSHFESTSATRGLITIADANTTGDSYVGIGANGDDLELRTGQSTKVTIDSSGNVGIGGSPSCPLHVQNNNYLKVLVQDVAGTATPFSIGSGTNGFTIANNTNANTADEAITLNALNQFAAFYTAGSERMRITSSGNVGIGTVSPSRLLDIENSSGAAFVSLVSSTADNAALLLGDTASDSRGRVEYENANDALKLYTAGSARMTIDSSGNLLVGKSSNDYTVNGAQLQANGQIGSTINSTPFFANRTNGDGSLMDFYINDVYVGKIQHTSGTVAIAQASDERLKQNVSELSGCLDQIKQIRPVSWDWNSREGGSIGVVAQEIQQIWPDVVDEGDDGYLTVAGISRVEARLIKAIQEQQAIIEDLQTRLSALEAN